MSYQITFKPQSIYVTTPNSVTLLAYNKISKFVSCANYTALILTHQSELLTLFPLTYFEENLPSYFFRINRSCILNLQFIDTYQYKGKQQLLVHFFGETLNVSRRKQIEFEKAMEAFLSQN